MVLSLREKERVVSKIREQINHSVSAIVASLEGVQVNKITALRKEARGIGVYMHVVRNTLMKRIVLNTPFSCLNKTFFGQSLIALSTKQPSDAARIFFKFSKENDSFKIKGAVFEGKFIPVSHIDLLSNLPTYNEAIAKFIMIIKMSSIGKFIFLLRILSSRKSVL